MFAFSPPLKTILLGLLSFSISSSIASPIARDDDYEYIVVGSGPGGGTVASRLARLGHSVLLLESGDDQSNNFNVTVSREDSSLLDFERLRNDCSSDLILFQLRFQDTWLTSVKTKRFGGISSSITIKIRREQREIQSSFGKPLLSNIMLDQGLQLTQFQREFSIQELEPSEVWVLEKMRIMSLPLNLFLQSHRTCRLYALFCLFRLWRVDRTTLWSGE